MLRSEYLYVRGFHVFVRRMKNYADWERECINYAYSFDTRPELRPLITSPFSPINWIIDTCHVRVHVRGSIIKSTKKRRFPGSDGLHGTRRVQLVSLRIGDGKLGNEGRNEVARLTGRLGREGKSFPW